MLTGTVEADRIALASRIGGRVQTIHIKEGETVAKGQLVISLDDPILVAQQQTLGAQLNQAEAAYEDVANGVRPEEIAQARAGLQTAQARLDALRNGSRPEEIAAADAQVGLAETRREQAADAWSRAYNLYEDGVIPYQELETAEHNLDAADNNLAAAEEQAALVREGPRSEDIAAAESLVRQQKALLDLLEAGATTEELNQAASARDAAAGQLAVLSEQLEELRVHAPIGGILDRLHVEIGEVVTPNQSLAGIRRTDEIIVVAYLPEPDLGHVAIMQEVQIELPGGDLLAGNIQTIASEAEFTPRNIQTPDERATQVFAMEVSIFRPPEFLRDGMTVTLRIDRTQYPIKDTARDAR